MKSAIPLLLFFLAACSNKYKSIYDAAQAPGLSFNKDTMRIREKDYDNITGWLNPILWIHSDPFTAQLNISYEDPGGRVHFTYRGMSMPPGKPIIVPGDSSSLLCSCDTAGLYRVDFYLTDQLGKVSSRPLMVDCLANDKGIARLFTEFIDSSLAGNWLYRFDATRTEKNYGRITGYYFLVNGRFYFSRTAVINWIFHSAGPQQVGLYVVDDLGLHSDTIVTQILIP